VIVEKEANQRLRRTPLYLFACHLEWCNKGRLDAYEELVAALDDSDESIRVVAEKLLHRSSPRRQVRTGAASSERR
jgi:hypothetical protein